MTAAERIALRNMPGVQKEYALHRPKLGPRTVLRKFGDDEDDEDSADHAIDDRDPLREFHDEPVKESELAQIGEAFAAALIWSAQAKSLVEMGWRMAAMLQVFRPALVRGMALEARLEHQRSLRKGIGGPRARIAKAGDYYRLVLAWLCRCDSLSQLGWRGFAMIYVMRRDLIAGKNGKNTNEALGALNNKTRQAFNKTVQDFRDCFRGFRNGVMRGDITRIRCRQAQTSRD